MKLAVMQPYLFPYIGYFQLINLADEFVVYDNIEFTKKGWINRNRILVNGTDDYVTIPLKKASDYLDVKERYLADSWTEDKKKLLNRITGSYRKSPFFNNVFPVIETCILSAENNLFNFIFNSITQVNKYLDIATPLVPASGIAVDHQLKSERKVIEICRARNAKTYINPIGGLELYSKENFSSAGIELQFLKPENVVYRQYQNEFVPWLSIIDVMMFNSQEEIARYLQSYTLV